MIWVYVILFTGVFAFYVWSSVTILARLLRKITNLDTKVSEFDKSISDLFDNDDWCEKEIESLSATSDELYDQYMTSINNVWKKMDELSNDINRAKMRIGKIEQKEGVVNESNHSFTADPIVISCDETSEKTYNS